MAGAHDPIAAAGAGTYESLDVRLFEHRLDIGGDAGGALLRLAHCHVTAGRQAHFVRAQAAVWNPGMAAAPGLLGGVFAQRGDAEFLVLSGWASEAAHADYVDGPFAALRERSGAADDLESIAGDLVDVEPAWTVHCH